MARSDAPIVCQECFNLIASDTYIYICIYVFIYLFNLYNLYLNSVLCLYI